MIEDLRDRRCSSIRRILHRIGDQPSNFGPLELGWADGRFTTLDAKADWTLDVAAGAWADPLVDVATDERLRVAKEIGVWEPSTRHEDLDRVIGRPVTAVEPILNEVGELVGLTIAFGDLALIATIESGNLTVSLNQQ